MFILDMLDFPQKSLVNYKRQVKASLALNINYLNESIVLNIEVKSLIE